MAVGKPILAVVLAGWLCFLTFCSASSSLHNLFSHGHEANNSSCVVCLLASGQVFHSVALPVVAEQTTALEYRLTPEHISPTCDFNYRFSPSRAPPQI